MDYVIETGGKQYLIKPGQKLAVEKLKAEKGQEVIFDKVLMKIDGDKVEIGTPYLEGEQVVAEVTDQVKGEKKIVFKYHNKTRYRKKKGHRQLETRVTIK